MSARVTARAWELASRLSLGSERLVLLALADAADHEGVSHHTVEGLKKLTGLSGKTVRDAIRTLEHHKLLTVRVVSWGRWRCVLALWKKERAALSIVSGATA